VAATAGGTLITGSAEVATTAGTIDTIARQTAPISATASAADVQSALQALDSISSGGVIVTGVLGEYFDLTFSGAKGYADQPEFTVENGTTAKPGKTADVNFATFALRDLLGNDPSVDLDLELELTESGTRSTVILQPCSVAEELIDANAFSPTSGYPSYIFSTTTTDYSFSGITTFSIVTGLSFEAQANSRYLVVANIYVDEEGTPIELLGKIEHPAGCVFIGTADIYDSNNQLIYTTGVPLNNVSGAAIAIADVGLPVLSKQKFSVQTASTAGTVSFTAANAGSVTAGVEVVKAGSWMQAFKVF